MGKAPKVLKDKIEDWLAKGGYPLEMQVCDAFSRNGFEVAPSDFYLDSQTGITREIDLVASLTTDYHGFWVSFTYVVECKNSPDKPWVAFENSNFTIDHGTTYLNQPSNKLGKIILGIISQKHKHVFKNLFFPSNIVAYSLVSALGSENDHAFKAMYSVTKATSHRINGTYDRENPKCEIFIPLIVLGANLFSAKLIHEKVELNEQNNISAFWRNNILPPYSMILVNTYDNIGNLVEKSKNELDRLASTLKGHREHILREIKYATGVNFFH
jgi:hypothetical protein